MKITKSQIEKVIEKANNYKPLNRSAWDRGVNKYVIELLEELQENIEGGYITPNIDTNRSELLKMLLNGASSWHDYSWGGCALCYDNDIAERLCTPSELKRTDNGNKSPNAREEWLDVQTRALSQAFYRIIFYFNNAEE